MTEQDLKKATAAAEQQAYKRMVNQTKPKPPVLRNSVWAFIIGGLICVFGQLLIYMYIAGPPSGVQTSVLYPLS